ncbi:MAG: hypothetical protein N3D73_02225 [Candidatus Diapherotrites archaeon]|nr:hypothetical protein [Candidatus Diapherotrites archaeon]
MRVFAIKINPKIFFVIFSILLLANSLYSTKPVLVEARDCFVNKQGCRDQFGTYYATKVDRNTPLYIITHSYDEDRDPLRLHVCKTNQPPTNPEDPNGCPGGTWCSNIQTVYEANVSCSFNSPTEIGDYNAYIFLFDAGSSGDNYAEFSTVDSFKVGLPIFLYADINAYVPLNSHRQEIYLRWTDVNADSYKLYSSSDCYNYYLLKELPSNVTNLFTILTDNFYCFKLSAVYNGTEIGFDDMDTKLFGIPISVRDTYKPTHLYSFETSTVDNNSIKFNILKGKDYSTYYPHLDNSQGSVFGWLLGNSFIPEYVILDLPFNIDISRYSYDISGRGHNGTFENGAHISAAGEEGLIIGPALFLDGDSANVNLGNISDFNFSLYDPFTISFWYKGTNDGNVTILSKMDAQNDWKGYRVLLIDGKVALQIVKSMSNNEVATIVTNNSINDNNWHFVVVSYDGRSYSFADAIGRIFFSSTIVGKQYAKIYVDGKQQDLEELSTFSPGRGNYTSIINNAPVRIGATTNGNNVIDVASNALIDELKVYKIVLSERNIRNLALQGTLIAYWNFENSVIFDNNSLIQDLSYNVNHIKLSNKNAASLLSGDVIGNYLSLNSTPSKVYVETRSANLNRRDFTLAGWFYIYDTNKTLNLFWNARTDNNKEGWALSLNSQNCGQGKLCLMIADEDEVSYLSKNVSLINNGWNFIAVTYSNGIREAKFYANGLYLGNAYSQNQLVVSKNAETLLRFENNTEPIGFDELIIHAIPIDELDINRLYWIGQQYLAIYKSTEIDGIYEPLGGMYENFDDIDINDWILGGICDVNARNGKGVVTNCSSVEGGEGPISFNSAAIYKNSLSGSFLIEADFSFVDDINVSAAIVLFNPQIDGEMVLLGLGQYQNDNDEYPNEFYLSTVNLKELAQTNDYTKALRFSFIPNPNKTNKLKIFVRPDNTIAYYINNFLYWDSRHQLTQPLSFALAFDCKSLHQDCVYFDNVKVTKLYTYNEWKDIIDNEVDKNAPLAPTSLSVLNKTKNSCTIRWNASQDVKSTSFYYAKVYDYFGNYSNYLRDGSFEDWLPYVSEDCGTDENCYQYGSWSQISNSGLYTLAEPSKDSLYGYSVKLKTRNPPSNDYLVSYNTTCDTCLKDQTVLVSFWHKKYDYSTDALAQILNITPNYNTDSAYLGRVTTSDDWEYKQFFYHILPNINYIHTKLYPDITTNEKGTLFDELSIDLLKSVSIGDVKDYYIYNVDAGSGNWVNANCSNGLCSYTITGLLAGTTYNFRVMARDYANNGSSFSNTVSCTTDKDQDDKRDCSSCSQLRGFVCGSDEVCLGSRLSSCNANETCCAVRCTKKADLTVSVVAPKRIMPESNFSINVNYQNIGGIDANNFKIVLLSRIGNNSKIIAEKIVSLPANDANTVRFSFYYTLSDTDMLQWAGSDVTFIAMVDYTNIINEYNENNNSDSLVISFGMPEMCNNFRDDDFDGLIDENCGLPNLYVKSIEMGKAKFSGSELISVDFNVVIGSEYSFSEDFYVSFYKDNLNNDPVTVSFIDYVAKDGQTKLMFVWQNNNATVFKLQGNENPVVRFYVYIDSRNNVYETNESDNIKRIDVVPTLADLTIENISFNKIIFFKEPLEINFDLSNIGSSDAENVLVGLYINNDLKETKRISLIKADEKINVGFLVTGLALGDYNIEIIVDLDNKIEEINENNNNYKSIVSVLSSIDEVITYNRFLQREPLFVGVWDSPETSDNYAFTSGQRSLNILEQIKVEGLSRYDFLISKLYSDLVDMTKKYSITAFRNNNLMSSKEFSLVNRNQVNAFKEADALTVRWWLDPDYLKVMHYARISSLEYTFWQIKSGD